MSKKKTPLKAHNIPIVRIGDLVRFHLDDGRIVLIVWSRLEHPHEGMSPEADEYWYGGVYVGDTGYTESVWIDVLHCAIHTEAYEIVGHIDLTKAIERRARKPEQP